MASFSQIGFHLNGTSECYVSFVYLMFCVTGDFVYVCVCACVYVCMSS